MNTQNNQAYTPAQSITTPLNCALEYANSGKYIFPVHYITGTGQCSCGTPDCSSPGKHPITQHGLKDASDKSDVIKDWWEQYPQANIGLATGAINGCIALDIDPRHGGNESMAEMESKYREIPETLITLTGGGGRHYLFEYPQDGQAYKNKTELAGYTGIDVRGDGGYILVPPSNHISGGVYCFQDKADMEKTPLAEAPDWLRNLILGGSQGDSPSRINRDEILNGTSEGQRNDTGFRYCASLRAKNLSKAEAEALMRIFASQCTPPLPEQEALNILTSVYDRYPAGLSSEYSKNKINKYEDRVTKYPAPLSEEAFHGLAGEIVHAIEPHTESDSAALLLQLLVCFGNIIGRFAYYPVEASKHFLNLFTVLVGQTAKGRKGTSFNHVKRIFSSIDLDWVGKCQQDGLSSGEGLICAVRDETIKKDKKGKNVVIEGVSDKRMLVVEPEFASVLKVSSREGNTLSTVVRKAWDDGRLKILTKNSPATATDAHISMIGHITNEELRRYLNSTEAANGFGNRFLWVCCRRSKCLPMGGNIESVDFSTLTLRLKNAVYQAKKSIPLKFD
ncbi:MAG: bifunctional DNA primase/polymerase, partial [Candidatus Margulisiibacteriota bacterium]